MLTSHQLVLESMGAGFSGSNSGGAGPSYARPDGAGLGRAETSGRGGQQLSPPEELVQVQGEA